MFETTVRLATVVFGGIIILATILLCLYITASDIFGSDPPIVEILLGGLVTGAGFIGFGIKGERLN